VTLGTPGRIPFTMTNACFLSAANHIYGLVSAVSAGNGHGLLGAAGHIGHRWSWRRRLSRAAKITGRKSMCPIPGNIRFVGVIYIV
jgi:hypothetical protein